MSTNYEVKSVSKAIAIITAIADNGFKGMTREQLAEAADVTYSAAYRMLKTLERHGWVRYSEKTKLWALSATWVRFSRKYDQYAVSQRQTLDAEYLEMTGEKFDYAKIN